jgi:hypothetical protein
MVALVKDYAPELIDDMGDLAAAASASGMSAGGIVRRYIRVQPVLGNELAYGQTVRPASNRHNAYPAPGALAEIADGGLEASDCDNINDGVALPTIGGAPPCRLAPGWKFEGIVRYYPHVEPAPPPK